MEKVECQDCGFLGIRDKKTGVMLEVIETLRNQQDDEPFDIPGQYHPYPLCALGAWDLRAEFNGECEPLESEAFKALPENEKNELEKRCYNLCSPYILPNVIELERPCNSFTLWKPGYTPKEHIEMNVIEMEKARIERKDEEDKQWRAKESQIALDRQENLQKKLLRTQIVWTVIISGAISLAIGILTAFISRGSLF